MSDASSTQHPGQMTRQEFKKAQRAFAREMARVDRPKYRHGDHRLTKAPVRYRKKLPLAVLARHKMVRRTEAYKTKIPAEAPICPPAIERNNAMRRYKETYAQTFGPLIEIIPG